VKAARGIEHSARIDTGIGEIAETDMTERIVYASANGDFGGTSSGKPPRSITGRQDKMVVMAVVPA
jgi:hypothetical protein